MPIVDKINALTGKTAETIEDAIANMSGGGSSSIFPVVTFVTDDGENYTCEKPFSEVYETDAESANVVVILKYVVGGEELTVPVFCSIIPGPSSIRFLNTSVEVGTNNVRITQMEFYFLNDESVSSSTHVVNIAPKTAN